MSTPSSEQWGTSALYPGELWYSAVGRRMRNWAYVNRPATLRPLVGTSRAKVNISYPNRLGRFARFVGSQASDAPWRCANSHTLVPYLLAFEPPETVAAAKSNSMAGTAEIPTSETMPRIRCCLAPRRVQYCNDCMANDNRVGPEAFWHRMHQLPAISQCLLHGGPLYESSVPSDPEPLDFWALHRSRCQEGGKPTAVEPLFDRPLRTAVARASRLALKDGLTSTLYLTHADYAANLRAAGFRAFDGHVASNAVGDAFETYLRKHHCQPETVGIGNWWRAAYTEIGDRLSPPQHILFRIFIQSRLDPASTSIVLPVHGGTRAHGNVESHGSAQ